MQLMQDEKMAYNINLYAIIQSLMDMDVPVVIKGGNALKAALREAKAPIDRATTDIDANWVTSTPDLYEMERILEQAIKKVYPKLFVVAKRNYGVGRSAGFLLTDSSGLPLVKFDIDVGKSTPVKEYQAYGFSFRGIPIENMLSDKISVISSQHIYRRCKDILDVYAIIKYTDFSQDTVTKLLSQRTLGDFSEFCKHNDMLKSSYDKLKCIINKPDFDTVYDTVLNYCKKLDVFQLNSVAISQPVTGKTKPKYCNRR